MLRPSVRPMDTEPTTATGERGDLLQALRKHRDLFLRALEGVSEEQARLNPTVSSLNLGGLVKHMAATVGEWMLSRNRSRIPWWQRPQVSPMLARFTLDWGSLAGSSRWAVWQSAQLSVTVSPLSTSPLP